MWKVKHLNSRSNQRIKTRVRRISPSHFSPGASRKARRFVLLLVTFAIALVGLLVLAGTLGGSGSSAAAYQPIAEAPKAPAAPQVLPEASVGSYSVECGVNSPAVRNSDNLVVSPGKPGAAHHVHDYVGNLSTNAFSTEATLLAAETTCTNGDLSSYYWPVLRVGPPSAGHGGHGAGSDAGILTPSSVRIEFRGSPVGNVVPLAPNVRTAAGNAHGFSQDGAGTDRLRWSCSGSPGQSSRHYPLCPPGEETVRTFDFASCWNGRSIDSPDHRSHLQHPDSSGYCPKGTFPVPQLHLELSYAVPAGSTFTIDAFPEERSSSLSDHAHFINLMSAQLMDEVVECINEGTRCAR